MTEKEMEKMLDGLSVEQTERLLEKEMNITGRSRKRIQKMAFEKTGLRSKRSFAQKLAACAAAVVLVFAALSVAGFDNVAAAIGRLFTFIPGVGITQGGTTAVYMAEPVTGQTRSGEARANLVSAVYSNGSLSVTVMIEGKALYHDDFIFTRNQDQMLAADCSLAVAADDSASAMLHISYDTRPPAEDDLFEIEMTGFGERLSFRMIPCRSYDDLTQIGPTDTQNNISLTATAHRADDRLTVWHYPLKHPGATNDEIVGYGAPATGMNTNRHYLQTETGKITETVSGIQLKGRTVYVLPESGQTATLHIPYLAMRREEKGKIESPLPAGYTTVKSGVEVKTSLGTIRIVEITRSQSEYEPDMDTILLTFEFSSKDPGMELYLFNFERTNGVMMFSAESAHLEHLEVTVGKNEKKLSLRITDLEYYLHGEYVIPLAF
jgi:hypothetical protein